MHAGNLDEIVGILPCRSFLLDGPVGDPDAAQMAELCRSPSFVPELASVEQLLARFRAEGSTLAIVVDEFGGTAGLVTIEDVADWAGSVEKRRTSPWAASSRSSA